MNICNLFLDISAVFDYLNFFSSFHVTRKSTSCFYNFNRCYYAMWVPYGSLTALCLMCL